MAAEPFSVEAVQAYFKNNKNARRASDRFSDSPNAYDSSSSDDSASCFQTYLSEKDQPFHLTLAYRPKADPTLDSIAHDSSGVRLSHVNTQEHDLSTPPPDWKSAFKYPLNNRYRISTPPDLFHDQRLRSSASPLNSRYSSSLSSPSSEIEVGFSRVDYCGRPPSPGSLSPISPRDLGFSESIQDSLTSQDVLQLAHDVSSARSRLPYRHRRGAISIAPFCQGGEFAVSRSENRSSDGLCPLSTEHCPVASSSEPHIHSKVGDLLGPDYLCRARSIPITPCLVVKGAKARIFQSEERASPSHSDSAESLFIGSDEEDSKEPNGAVVVDGKGSFVGLAFGEELIRTKESEAEATQVGDRPQVEQGEYADYRNEKTEKQNENQSQDSTSSQDRRTSSGACPNKRHTSGTHKKNSRKPGSENKPKTCGCPPSKTCSRCRPRRSYQHLTTEEQKSPNGKARVDSDEKHKELAQILFPSDFPPSSEPSSSDPSPSRKRPSSEIDNGCELNEPVAKKSRSSTQSKTTVGSHSEAPTLFVQQKPRAEVKQPWTKPMRRTRIAIRVKAGTRRAVFPYSMDDYDRKKYEVPDWVEE